MNKLLKYSFYSLLITMMGSAIVQLFFPKYLIFPDLPAYSFFWQHEIGLWNISLLPIFYGILKHYNIIFLKYTIYSLIIGGALLGTNHLIFFSKNHTAYMHLIGGIENYFFVILWSLGYYIEKNR